MRHPLAAFADAGHQFVQDIVIPAIYAVLACAGAIGGVLLLYTR